MILIVDHDLQYTFEKQMEYHHPLFLGPYQNHGCYLLLHPALTAAKFQPGSDSVLHSVAKCC